MANEIKLPELGEKLTGGDVLEVKVAPGDMVEKGQALIELEAEKSTFEVPSPVAGRIAQVLVKKGDTVKIGQAFCSIEGAEETKKEAPKTAAAAATPPEKASAKVAPVEANAPAEAKTAAAAPSGPAKPAEAPPSLAAETKADSGGESNGEKPVPAGPATRRLARELGLDLRRVPGTAKGGRVTQEDIKSFVRQMASGNGSTGRGSAAQPELPDFEKWGPIERKTLDAVRRKTAEHMSLSWSLIPHVTQHDLADITELDAFRKQQEGQGPKLTVTAFALKAAAIVLEQMPQFNSSLDLKTNQLILKRYFHIGLAVDTDRGLLVPVLRDVDKKSVTILAREMAAIAEKAREKKIQMEDMRGGTFTITNLGGIGGTAFTPIVNYPEVAILGMSRARLEPVVREGQIVPRLMLPLSLSYDHRVIDGADAARFTRRIAQLLENPMLMVLHA